MIAVPASLIVETSTDGLETVVLHPDTVPPQTRRFLQVRAELIE